MAHLLSSLLKFHWYAWLGISTTTVKTGDKYLKQHVCYGFDLLKLLFRENGNAGMEIILTGK